MIVGHLSYSLKSNLHFLTLSKNAQMRVLLVDDHQLFSAGLSVLLEQLSAGALVVCVTSIARALEKPGDQDLILLDLHLPDANGFEGLRRLKAAHGGTPIVIVSSEYNPLRIRDCIQWGAMGFVSKSSSAGELVRALTLILAGETYLPPPCVAMDRAGSAGKIGPVHLSPRQTEVLHGVVQGKPNKTIARELGISDQTVKSHVMAVLSALGVRNRTEAVYRAAALGL